MRWLGRFRRDAGDAHDPIDPVGPVGPADPADPADPAGGFASFDPLERQVAEALQEVAASTRLSADAWESVRDRVVLPIDRPRRRRGLSSAAAVAASIATVAAAVGVVVIVREGRQGPEQGVAGTSPVRLADGTVYRFEPPEVPAGFEPVAELPHGQMVPETGQACRQYHESGARLVCDEVVAVGAASYSAPEGAGEMRVSTLVGDPALFLLRDQGEAEPVRVRGTTGYIEQSGTWMVLWWAEREDVTIEVWSDPGDRTAALALAESLRETAAEVPLPLVVAETTALARDAEPARPRTALLAVGDGGGGEPCLTVGLPGGFPLFATGWLPCEPIATAAAVSAAPVHPEVDLLYGTVDGAVAQVRVEIEGGTSITVDAAGVEGGPPLRFWAAGLGAGQIPVEAVAVDATGAILGRADLAYGLPALEGAFTEVARGLDPRPWRLGARRADGGQLCLALMLRLSPPDPACATVAPGDVQVLVHEGLIYGVLGPDVASLDLFGPGTDAPERVDLLGFDAGFDAAFFVRDWSAAGPALFVARDADGAEVGQQVMLRGGKPGPRGEPVALAAGEGPGGPWQVVAAPSSPGRVCFGVGYGEPAAGACIALYEPLKEGVLAAGTSDPALVVGVASPGIHQVRVALEGGEQVTVDTAATPEGFPDLPDGRWFVAEIPAGATATAVTGLDQSGRELTEATPVITF